MALRETQQEFYSLDLNPSSFVPSTDDSVNLLKLPVGEAEEDGSLRFAASTYDYQDDIIRDEMVKGGRKVITFANILRYDFFPRQIS
jgi:hypothetical protein